MTFDFNCKKCGQDTTFDADMIIVQDGDEQYVVHSYCVEEGEFGEGWIETENGVLVQGY